MELRELDVTVYKLISQLSLQEFTEALQNKENKRYTDDDQGT